MRRGIVAESLEAEGFERRKTHWRGLALKLRRDVDTVDAVEGMGVLEGRW
jgi:hypothetical protein